MSVVEQITDSIERQLVLIDQPQFLLIACIAGLPQLAEEVPTQSSHHQKYVVDQRFPIYGSALVPLLRYLYCMKLLLYDLLEPLVVPSLTRPFLKSFCGRLPLSD